MRFGQVIEYNKRKSFPEKSFTKYGAGASPGASHKKSKLNISLD